MYKKVSSVECKSSASLLYNNFDVLTAEDENETSFNIVHKTSIIVFNPTLVQNADVDSENLYKRIICKGESAHYSSMILQAKWCVLPQRTLLVITSVKGVQMFEADGSIMVFWQALTQHANGGVVQYARGIAAVGEKYICVGTADGGILVYEIPPKGTALKFQETLSVHECSITDIQANGDTMISGDESGKMIIWNSGGHFVNIKTIEGYGYPATSICLWKTFVIAGYGSGHVRIFSFETGVIIVEIAAHAKWINAIDIAPQAGLLLTTSEDSYVRVFNLHNFELCFQKSAGDIQLTGGRFLDEDGKSFGVTGYDSTEVQIFQKE